VAAWAARPIDLGPGNAAFRVHVLGPDQIPRIVDLPAARRQPELSFLSALAHAEADNDPDLVRAALAGLGTLDSARMSSYVSVLLDSLSAGLRGALEACIMEPPSTMTSSEAVNTDTDHTSNERARKGPGTSRAGPLGGGVGGERKRRDEAREEGRRRGACRGMRGARSSEDCWRARGCSHARGPARADRGLRGLALLDRWIEQVLTRMMSPRSWPESLL
jgi:hypothetical protein